MAILSHNRKMFTMPAQKEKCILFLPEMNYPLTSVFFMVHTTTSEFREHGSVSSKPYLRGRRSTKMIFHRF